MDLEALLIGEGPLTDVALLTAVPLVGLAAVGVDPLVVVELARLFEALTTDITHVRPGLTENIWLYKLNCIHKSTTIIFLS